ncbi:HTH-type transcriptional repressor YtrA [Corynebacterium ciconiae DSM 44920]|uniref:GntR family transcriptional regulator n=1 Tax=Corynebacterium ciconiae TaxID=227319 RepID=UPI0003641CFA|nr:GntR family transcriptional regulator [Corynebacterium ciconiae]WKD61860.1 HTH-type transcriptional repressor YtrA [Corynebacterium ciconiae DSM 44920]
MEQPMFERIAADICDLITRGVLSTGERAPSTNELARYHSVNPTTAAKALTLLHTEGLVEKRRGLGMFVTENARDTLTRRRREQLDERFIAPLLREAHALDMDLDEVIELLRSHPIPTTPTEV